MEVLIEKKEEANGWESCGGLKKKQQMVENCVELFYFYFYANGW